jgi:hypothetical protein
MVKQNKKNSSSLYIEPYLGGLPLGERLLLKKIKIKK